MQTLRLLIELANSEIKRKIFTQSDLSTIIFDRALDSFRSFFLLWSFLWADGGSSRWCCFCWGWGRVNNTALLSINPFFLFCMLSSFLGGGCNNHLILIFFINRGTSFVAALAKGTTDNIIARAVFDTTTPEETIGQVVAWLKDQNKIHRYTAISLILGEDEGRAREPLFYYLCLSRSIMKRFHALGIASFGPVDLNPNSST